MTNKKENIEYYIEIGAKKNGRYYKSETFDVKEFFELLGPEVVCVYQKLPWFLKLFKKTIIKLMNDVIRESVKNTKEDYISQTNALIYLDKPYQRIKNKTKKNKER